MITAGKMMAFEFLRSTVDDTVRLTIPFMERGSDAVVCIRRPSMIIETTNGCYRRLKSSVPLSGRTRIGGS